MDIRAPNLFILGAAKAGTTTLYHYLDRHPEIYFSQVKEPQYFCHEGLYDKGMTYYLDTFFKGADRFRVRGEATPHYLYYEKAARRIANDLNRENLRFIVILRDPVARAYSLYWNMVAEGIEPLSFEQAIEAEKTRLNDPELEYSGSVSFQYLDSGLYTKQIESYLKYFNKRQFLFVLFDDLSSNPQSVLNEVCDFLEISRFNILPEIRKTNASNMPRSQRLHTFLRGSGRVKHFVGGLLPSTLKYKVMEILIDANKRSVRYPEMCVETKDKLKKYFSADLIALEEMTGKSLENWL